MAETLETLFSFELLVEYVQFDKLSKGKTQLKPAVGVRLLDFPTLLIYSRDFAEPEGQHNLDSEKENTLGHDLMLQPQGRTSEYSFHKGKSCLFKMSLDALHLHLSNTPLYAMVLDISSEIPKFVGGSLIPLAILTERIKEDVELRGICTPSAHGERTVVAVCNLMGEKIGNISLGYKLLSLGASLMPHISESQIYKVGSAKGKDEKERFTDKVNGVKKATVTLQPEPDSSAVLSQKVELEGKQTDIIVSESKANMQRVKSTGTQTEGRKKKTKSEVPWSTFDSEINPAVICPPPLFYRRPVKGLEESNLIKYTSADVGVQSFSTEGLCSEEAEEAAGDNPPKSDLCHHKDKAASNRPTQNQALGHTVRQLPLLNQLLLELSQLNIQPQQQPLRNHPNLDSLYQPVPEQLPGGVSDGGSKAQAPNSALSPTARAKSSSSPRSRTNKCLGCSAASLFASPVKMETAKWQSQKQAKICLGSNPKRKLVYGLTNTFRLRMLRTNPELLKKHEYREQHRKVKAQQIMHHLKLPEAKSKTSSHKSDGSKKKEVFNRTVMLDKNVQTFTSGVMNSHQEECAQLQGRSKQGHVNYPVCKSAESDGQSFSSSPTDVSKGNLKKKLTRNRKEKEMVDPVTSVLSQNSNNNEDLWSDVSQPHTVNLAAYNTVASPVQKLSDSEQVEYLDDFETTEGSSPDFLSSPEPALRNNRRTVSEDCFSLDSGPQSGQEAILPTPIRGDTSPQHTLQGTHLIKAQAQFSYDSDTGSDFVRPTHHRLFQHLGVTADSRSTPCDLGSSMSQSSDCLRDTPSVLDSCKPTNDSEPESVPSPGPEVSLTEQKDDEMRDELGSLGFENKYHHISELVINKLPGYTL